MGWSLPRWIRIRLFDDEGEAYTPTNRLPVDAELSTADIEIGAVEIKDAESATRLKVDTDHLTTSKDERDNAACVSSGNYGYYSAGAAGAKMTPFITDIDDNAVATGQQPQVVIAEMHYYDWKSQSWKRWTGDDGFAYIIDYRTKYVLDDDDVDVNNTTASSVSLNYGYEEENDNWIRQRVNKYGHQEVSARLADTSNIDAFGRLRVSNPETIFDSKNIFDDPNQNADEENQILFFDNQETSGTGTSTAYDNDTASQSLTVSDSTAGTRVRQTKQRFNYQPGKSLLTFMTFTFCSGCSGITQREGMFDENNGLFLQDNGGVLSFVRRTYVTGSAVDNVITQANWNIDKFDGTGKSGIEIDLTKTNILAFDFEWLGVGRVRMGFVVDGLIYYCHEFLNANNLTEVYMSNPNLPLRSEISNDGTGSESTMTQICSTIISEGGQNPLGNVRSINTAGTHLDANTENTTYALIGIRLHPNYLNEIVEVLNIELQLQTGDDRLIWELRFNPAVADTFTYNAQNQSAVQYALGATNNTVTGGYIIDSGFAESGGRQAGNVGSTQANVTNALKLGSLIDGTPDEIVLCVTPVGGSTNVDVEGSLTWRELN